jgi:hypothetical protein
VAVSDRADIFQMCEAADADVTAGPHAWIQWKGTDVCMDVHCSCGEHTHVDADFTYYIRCGACGKLWAMCANVRMIEVGAGDIEGGCEPVESQVSQ